MKEGLINSSFYVQMFPFTCHCVDILIVLLVANVDAIVVEAPLASYGMEVRREMNHLPAGMR